MPPHNHLPAVLRCSFSLRALHASAAITSNTAITAAINWPITGIKLSASTKAIANEVPIILEMALAFCQPYSAFTAVMIPNTTAIAIPITAPAIAKPLAALAAVDTALAAALAAVLAAVRLPPAAFMTAAVLIAVLTNAYVAATASVVCPAMFIALVIAGSTPVAALIAPAISSTTPAAMSAAEAPTTLRLVAPAAISSKLPSTSAAIVKSKNELVAMFLSLLSFVAAATPL